jgi:hypothetical protein
MPAALADLVKLMIQYHRECLARKERVTQRITDSCAEQNSLVTLVDQTTSQDRYNAYMQAMTTFKTEM